MPAYDTHLHAFQDDRTARASRDRINQAKEHWRAYIQGRAELELTLNKLAIEQDILLSKWRAHVRGWDIGVEVECRNIDGHDVLYVYRTSGSNGYSQRRLIATLTEAQHDLSTE